jgi:hypothetical protein
MRQFCEFQFTLLPYLFHFGNELLVIAIWKDISLIIIFPSKQTLFSCFPANTGREQLPGDATPRALGQVQPEEKRRPRSGTNYKNVILHY